MRILVRSALGVLCALAGCAAFGVSIAPAAATHEFLPELSEKISEGVPAISGAQFTGPLVDPESSVIDTGDLWVDESLDNGGSSRVDKWNASTGVFLAPQIDTEDGVTFSTTGFAVGDTGGEEQVYVGAGHDGKIVIAVYGPSGKLLPAGVWTGANTPAKEFKEEIQGLAVDNSTSLETGGDLYVAADGVVNVFKPQAGGAEPANILGQLTGTPSGPFHGVTSVAVSGFNGDVLVAEGEAEACRQGTGECKVEVFAPAPGMPGVYNFMFSIAGAPQASFTTSINQMAVDGGDGDIYIADRVRDVVDEFDYEGKYLGQLVGAPIKKQGEVLPFASIGGVAVEPISHDVYVADYRAGGTENSVVDAFGPNRVTPDVTTGEAADDTGTGDGHIRFVLNGTVNPEKEGEASCQFVWGATGELGRLAPCEPKTVGEGAGPVPVQASLSGLPPDTTYDYRLQATNKNGTNPGEAWQTREFTTVGPGMHGESASSTRSESVTFDAKIDPHGKPTSYYFQYGNGAGYGTDVPVPGEEALRGATVGSGESDIEVFQHVTGLAIATLYHYRVVVVSELAPGEFETFYGPAQTFSTQTIGLPFQLPDGRAWELVSPPHKEGALLSAISPDPENPLQAAANGEAITDGTSIPIEAEPAGGANYPMAFFGRGASGWSATDITPPHIGRTELTQEEYKYFSEDLTTGALQPEGRVPPLSPGASEATAYLHTDFLNDNPGELCTTGCYEPLVSLANVPPGTKFGEEGGESDPPDCQHGSCGGPEFVGATPDMQHVVLTSGADLTSASLEGNRGMYEWNEGTLSLVNLLPEGETNYQGGPVAGGAGLGQGSREARNAISNDGSRVIWTFNNRLYSRDVVDGKTTRLDVVETGAAGPEPGTKSGHETIYQAASSDGSRVFFLEESQLTPNSTARNGHPDLYEYNFNAALGNRLTDLSVDPNEPADVASVLGTSEDGSYVYFTAAGAIAPGATPGECRGTGDTKVCNLYVHHNSKTTLIAGLSPEDYPVLSKSVNTLPARVSHNGKWLAFMSDADLTGYDTTDAVHKHPDQEVYLYDAATNKLVCAGCNPTGALPLGAEDTDDQITGLGGYRERYLEDEGVWIASNVPAWTDQFYQSRYLSNSGRLFFDSSDALVPQDVNGTEDVYEYEPAGVGGCDTSQTTFSERSEGCVDLISSGASKDESGFLDASEGGGDVFFLTTAKLLPQDVDDSPDIYDARECSATRPCFAPPPVEPPPCETGDSCKAAPSPQPAIFGSPASATFAGAGNVAAPEPPAVKAKIMTRAQKLAQALKACRKQNGKKKRATCERQVRSRYGAKKSRKVKATKRGRG